MTEQAGASGPHGKDPPGAAGSFARQIGVLEEAEEDIDTARKAMHRGALNLLEDELVEFEQEPVRLAVRLYLLTRACRDIVEDKRFSEFLRSIDYTTEDAEVLLGAFDNLTDDWSAYRPVIERYVVAVWEQDPAPDKILTALKKPRRAYIYSLGAYHIQLLIVIEKLKAAGYISL